MFFLLNFSEICSYLTGKRNFVPQLFNQPTTLLMCIILCTSNEICQFASKQVIFLQQKRAKVYLQALAVRLSSSTRSPVLALTFSVALL